MTRMTRPDCAVMCNFINTHTHTRTVPPVLSTGPIHTNSGRGKERRILIGPW